MNWHTFRPSELHERFDEAMRVEPASSPALPVSQQPAKRLARQARNGHRQIGPIAREGSIRQHLQHAIAAAAIEACARELEAWAEINQRADLVHAAAAKLRRNSALIAAQALTPTG